MLPIPHTLDLALALCYWTMSAALEVKQTSHNASTMGSEISIATVYPVKIKMLVFTVMQVSTWGIGTLSSVVIRY